MKFRKLVNISAILLAASLTSATTIADDHDGKPKYGFAGLLSKKNRTELPKLFLASGKDLSTSPIELKSGGYYVLPIESDGSQELALDGPGFFRAIWVNEVVINDLEIRPFGMESMEFDDEGVIELKFVAIKPGSYHLKVPGSTSEGRRVSITIK